MATERGPLVTTTGTCSVPDIQSRIPVRIDVYPNRTVLSCEQLTRTGRCRIAKIDCPIRRTLPASSSHEQIQTTRRIIPTIRGVIDYDPANRTVYNWPGKQEIDTARVLTPIQNALLQALTASLDELVTHETLSNAMWPDGIRDEEYTRTVHIPKRIGELKNLLNLQNIEDSKSGTTIKIIESIKQRLPRLGGYRLNTTQRQNSGTH